MQVEAKNSRVSSTFTHHFGQVRPPISADYLGYRFVVAGNKVLYQPKEKAQFFTDILLNFVLNTFGKEWFDAEVAKPRGTRHPAFEARYRAMSYMNAQPRDAQGVYKASMTGPILEYFTFAYDLFTVQDNGRLDARLIERLKNCNQFQGARHELFAEATCLRAGFFIEHEDETDGLTRHAEFTATHKATGQKVSVEAKSKHRPGILGFPGARQAEGEHNLNVGHLLNDAIRKNTVHPLVVFFDLNLPWLTANRLLDMHIPPHPLIHGTLNRMRRRHSGRDPINLLVVTNHPEHYSADEEAAPSPQLLSIQTQLPVTPVAWPMALRDIHQAANVYGRIPQFFDGSSPAGMSLGTNR
ncbi:MAG: hypothetical protein ABSD72_18890 [Terracidiphilus sp.]|jgi:hypothetical protein